MFLHNFSCISTREHTLYTVDVAPNLVKRATYLLCRMATTPLYQEWEIKDVYKVMKKDVEILNRRKLNDRKLIKFIFLIICYCFLLFIILILFNKFICLKLYF